jgi:hypothetical protein
MLAGDIDPSLGLPEVAEERNKHPGRARSVDGDAIFQAVRQFDSRENYTLDVLRRIGHALVVALILERDVSPTLTKKLIQQFFYLLNIDRKLLGRGVIELRPNEGVTLRSVSGCQRG